MLGAAGGEPPDRRTSFVARLRSTHAPQVAFGHEASFARVGCSCVFWPTFAGWVPRLRFAYR